MTSMKSKRSYCDDLNKQLATYRGFEISMELQPSYANCKGHTVPLGAKFPSTQRYVEVHTQFIFMVGALSHEAKKVMTF